MVSNGWATNELHGIGTDARSEEEPKPTAKRKEELGGIAFFANDIPSTSPLLTGQRFVVNIWRERIGDSGR